MTIATTALRTDNRRDGQVLDDDTRLQASVASALQSSLRAPNRNRSISVDDFRDDAHPHRGALPDDTVDLSSSDSDDDENEDLSRRHIHENRVPNESRLQRKKRSSSALSLESSQNDSDGSDPPLRLDGTPDLPRPRGSFVKVAESSPKRPKLAEPLVEPQERRAGADVRVVKPGQVVPVIQQIPDAALNNTAVNHAARPRVPQTEPKAAVSSHTTTKVIACAKCGATSHLRDAGGRFSPACQCARKVGARQITQAPIHTNSPHTEDEVITIKSNSATTNELTTAVQLVNIAAIPETDGSGWDRFIFFSFRPQRFHFPQQTYLSAFSPFAAVASHMDGVSSKSVCAVCGGSEALVECCRCPLAFHSRCIDPLRQRMASHPWFCDSCQAVKGSDHTQGWIPLIEPPPLPSPATSFGRLIADAKEGNPIDFVFNPTLHRFYKSECGEDWLRCSRCNQITIAEDGVLAESVYAPFECRYAFWGEQPGPCRGPEEQRPKSDAVKRIEAYNKRRSRRRNALFYYGFGEEDRESLGYPSLNRNQPVADVIVIDDESEPVASEPIPTVAVVKRAPKPVLEAATPIPRLLSRTVRPVERPTPETVALAQRPMSDKVTIPQRPTLEIPAPAHRLMPEAVTLAPRQTSAGGKKADHCQVNSSQQSMKRTLSKPDALPRVGTNLPTSAVANFQRKTEIDVGLGRSMGAAQNNNVGKISESPETEALKTSGAKNHSPPARLTVPYAVANGDLQRVTSDGATESQPRLTAGVPGNSVRQSLAENDAPHSSRPPRQSSGPNLYAPGSFHPDHGLLNVADNRLPLNYSRTSLENRGAVNDEDDVKQEDQQYRQWDRTDTRIQEQVLECIASIDFDVDTEDCLTDLALVNDKELCQLYIGMYKQGNAKFKRQATRLARRRSAQRSAQMDAGTSQNKRNHVEAYPVSYAGHQGELSQQTFRTQLVQTGVERIPAVVATERHIPSMRPPSHGSALSDRIKQIHALYQREYQEVWAAMRRELEVTPLHAVSDAQNRQRARLDNLKYKYEAQLRQLTDVHLNASASIR